MPGTTTHRPHIIRPATEDDIPDISSLGSHVFSATFGHSVTQEQLSTFLRDSYSIEALRKDILNPDKDIIVAVSDQEPQKLLGFAYLTRGSKEPCIEDVPDTVELQRLYVDTSAHGQGIGGALSARIDDMAREQGFKNIWLGVWEENLKASKAYQKWGYRKVGTHDFDVGGDIQTDNVMMKRL